MTHAGYTGPTYSVAPPEYVCNQCGHREPVGPPEYVCNQCGHREPVGRSNNMGQREGSVPMLRHLRDEHGYKPRNPIRDWQERIEWKIEPRA